MPNEITIQIQVGSVSFSFKTDESGDGIEDGIKAIQKLIKAQGKLLRSLEPTAGSLRINAAPAAPESSSSVSLGDLNIEPELKNRIIEKIRKVTYWDLVLTILHYSKQSLSYDDMMSISKEIGKPISYDWFNTEFQRKKYRGLVRSEEIGGTRKRAYSITELGRKRVERFFDKLGN